MKNKTKNLPQCPYYYLKLFTNSPHIEKRTKQLNQVDYFCLTNYTKLEGETEQRPRREQEEKFYSRSSLLLKRYQPALWKEAACFLHILEDANK